MENGPPIMAAAEAGIAVARTENTAAPAKSVLTLIVINISSFASSWGSR
jgi:hypothetical protein